MSLLDQLSNLCNNTSIFHQSNFFDFQKDNHSNINHCQAHHQNQQHKQYRSVSMTTTPVKIISLFNQNQDSQTKVQPFSFKNSICATQRKQPAHSQIQQRYRNLTRISFIIASKVRKIYYEFFNKFQKIKNQKHNQTNLESEEDCTNNRQNQQKEVVIQQFIPNLNCSKDKKKPIKSLKDKQNSAKISKFVETLSILHSKIVLNQSQKDKICQYYKKLKDYSVFKKLFQSLNQFANKYQMKNAFSKVCKMFKLSVKIDILIGSLKCIVQKKAIWIKRETLKSLKSIQEKIKQPSTIKIDIVFINQKVPLQQLSKSTLLSQIAATPTVKQSSPLLIQPNLKYFKSLLQKYFNTDSQTQKDISLPQYEAKTKSQHIPLKLNKLLACDQPDIVSDVMDNGHMLINLVKLNNYFGLHQNDINLNHKDHVCLKDNNNEQYQFVLPIRQTENSFQQQQDEQDQNKRQKKIKFCHSNHQSMGFSLNLKKGQIQQSSKSFIKQHTTNNNQLETIRKSIKMSSVMIKDVRDDRKPRSSLVSTQRKEWDVQQSMFDGKRQRQQYCTTNTASVIAYPNNIVIDVDIDSVVQRKKISLSKNVSGNKRQTEQVKSTQHKKILDKILTELNTQYLQKSNKKKKQSQTLINCTSITKQNKQLSSQKKIKNNIKISLKQSVLDSKKKSSQNHANINLSLSNSKSKNKYSKNSKSNINPFEAQKIANTKQFNSQLNLKQKQQKQLRIKQNISKIEKFFNDQPLFSDRKLMKKSKALNVSLKEVHGQKNQTKKENQTNYNSHAPYSVVSSNFMPNFDDIQINFGDLEQINCSVLKKPTQPQSSKPRSRQSIQYIESLLQTMRSNTPHQIPNNTTSNYQTYNPNYCSNISYFSNKLHHDLQMLNQAQVNAKAQQTHNNRTKSQKTSIETSKIFQISNCHMKKQRKKYEGLLNNQENQKGSNDTITGIRLSIKRNSFKKEKQSWEDMFQKQKSKFLNLTKPMKENQKKSRKKSHNETTLSNIQRQLSFNKIKPRKSFILTTTNLQSLVNSKVKLYSKTNVLGNKNLNVKH